MKKFILCLIFIFNILFSFAQPFSIGRSSQTFSDASRSNRSVPSDVYYPATSNGVNTPLASSPNLFKVVVVAHGFFMGTDAYVSFSEKLASEGFIVAVVNTETGLSPSHLEFGKDIAFTVKSMNELSNLIGGFFYNKIEPRSAVIGHSMGGGASFLSISFNTEIKALINFAAAETTPSAISAATSITIPSLIYAGSKDCVAPPANHQIKMYDSLASLCKTLITINDGTHCQFADNNFACNAGETTCLLGSSYISRSQQYELIYQTLLPFLKGILDNNNSSWNQFKTTVSSSDSISYLQTCTTSPLFIKEKNELTSTTISIFPNPTKNQIDISSTHDFSNVKLFSSELKKIKEENFIKTTTKQIDLSNFSSGIYFIKIDNLTFKKIILID